MKHSKKIYVDGCKYPLIRETKQRYESLLDVLVNGEIKHARPCYIGWTFAGYTFIKEQS